MKQLFVLLICTIFAAVPAFAGKSDAERELKDLYFGEALYQAYQQDWFGAISRLDTELAQHYLLDEPQLDSLFQHLGAAEFSVGDFELAYRMHQRAGRAINAVIEGDVEDSVRNAAIYRLARIYFQKAQPVNALHALERIEGDVPADIEDDLADLSAQVLMATGRFTEAIELLKKWLGDRNLEGFAGYNLGIALLLDGQDVAALKQLETTGQLKSKEPLLMAVKDKTNLVLADRLLVQDRFVEAKTIFDRVRLEGAFSNRALLGSGWADAVQDKLERALVPWSLLSKREVTDAAVQEAMLAVPYAYGKLGIYSRAALLYGSALQAFAEEIDKLSNSIISVREGDFLRTLAGNELTQNVNWIVRLRELPKSPETNYLLELMASHDFQEALKNYLDLEHLRHKLDRWQTDLDAYAELIEQRRNYYQPLLPQMDEKFRLLDAQMRLRLEQRDRIEQRLNGLLTAPRPELLLTADERIVKERLLALSVRSDVSAVDRQRIKRLDGLLLWQINNAYDQRQTDAFKHLYALNEHITALQQKYHSFVRLRQAATQSYKGYDDSIRQQRIRMTAASEKIDRLMNRQGHVLEVMAINELERRRERLEEFQVKARFAMADSYDRASQNKNQDKEQP
jgi:Flp pilus assembly protein TadD